MTETRDQGRARKSSVPLRSIGIVVGAALATTCATLLSLGFRIGEAELPSLWLGNGVILTSLLATPRRIWPPLMLACGVSLAAIDAFYLGDPNVTSAINVLEAFLGALLIRRFGGPIGSLMSLNRMAISFACVLLVAAPVGAALGTLAAWATDPSLDTAAFFRIWFFGDALGLILVSPAVHAIEAKRLKLPDYEALHVSRPETGLFWLVFLAISIPVMSVDPDPARNLGDLHYGLFPVLLWASFRLEPWVSLTAILLVAAFAAWQAASGFGPFFVEGQPDAGRVLSFQIPTLTTAMSVQALLVLSNERRYAARRLRESSERFRNIVETTNEWIWELNTRLVCTYSSPHCEPMTGYTPEEIVGLHLYATIHEEDIPRFRQLVRTFVSTRAPIYNFAHRHYRKDGSIVHVESNAVPIVDAEGVLLGYRGSHRDVTDRVEAAAAERSRQESNARADKLIALGTVVSGVAHEIDNPNQFIMSNLPVLRRAWQDVETLVISNGQQHPNWTVAGLPASEAVADINDVLDDISDGSDRIRTIITELRDYVRGESNYAFERLNPNQVVKSAARMLRGSLGSRGHRVEVVSDPRPPEILGNGPRVEQVIINLIANASEALEDSARNGVVRVSVGPREEGARYPIRVEDDGPGIDVAHLERVLDPFFSTKRAKGGTGLGLAISSRIAREHDGALDIRPRPSGGTCATLWLNVAD